MSFWRNFYRVEESSKFGAKLFWVQGTTNLEGVPRETTIGGGGGGVRCDLIYLTYISMKATLKVKAKLFVLCFAIKNKKYTEKKDRPSIFISHHAIYDVKYCLFGIRTRKKV